MGDKRQNTALYPTPHQPPHGYWIHEVLLLEKKDIENNAVQY